MNINQELIARFLAMDSSFFQGKPELLSLWYDGKGNWEKSHDQVDQLSGKNAARIHAYLHRKEGDQWNADYWYRRAGEKRPDITLEEEWIFLVQQFWKND
jgi:hypothetical protein